MKHLTRILLSLLLVLLVSLPLLAGVVIAFSGSFTKIQNLVVTDNTGVTRTNVPVTLSSINGTTYKTSAYINLQGTNTAMTDNTSGADTEFMMQDGVNSGLIIPTLPAYGTVSHNLLMGTSVNQTGFPMIFGSGGYATTTDAPNLENSANVSLSASVDIGHSSNITRKTGALLLLDNGAGTVTGNITSVGSISVVQSLSNTNYSKGGAPTMSRFGQYLPSLSAGSINSTSFYFSDIGGSTGTANITVRKASDDSIIGLLGTQDVSLVGAGGWFTYNTPVVNPTKQDVIILFEQPTTSDMNFAAQVGGDPTYGYLTFYQFPVYSPNGNADTKIQYVFQPSPTATSVVATGVANGKRAVSLVNANHLLTLTIDSVLQDFIYGANMTDTVNDWLWLEGVPYADNITYSANGTQQLYYAPTAMISGSTLPDRSADATNNDGTITWGSNSGLVVTYGSVVNAPEVRTNDASGVLSSSAYAYGAVMSLGSETYVNAGFDYGLDTNYGLGRTAMQQLTTLTSFAYPLTGLFPNTVYHFRAVMTAGSLTVFGEDKTFTTQPVAGSSTTILIRSAKMFQDYITTGDYLLVVEVLNNYTSLYPSQSPREHFTIQLLDLDNTTILGASPLTNWGDRPASIYFNPTAGAGLIVGANYFVKMIGDAAANYTSVEYTLQVSDWKGFDLTALDSWSVGTAINMAISDGVAIGTYVAYPTNQQAVINDAAGGYFTTGIPAIGGERPHLFATAQYTPTVTAGTASNTWDKTDADPAGWRAFVGASLAADIDKFALPLGATGKDFAAGAVMLAMLGCVMFVVGSGGAQALGGVFISIPILWLGVFARAVPIAAIIVVIIFFSAFAIRQFVIKTL